MSARFVVLYDHVVTRRAAPVGYDALSPEAQLELAEYAFALQRQHPGRRLHRSADRHMEIVATHARPLRVKLAASAPHLRYR